MTAVNDRLPVWPVYRACLRAWRRDFWRLAALAAIVLLPLLLVEFALYGVADISLTTDDSLSLWIVSIPVFVYSIESHHFLAGLIERLEGAERHGHPAPRIGGLLRDLPWARLFWADMLFTLLFVAGLAVLIIPGVVVGTYFVLVMPLINMDRRPVRATFARSYRLVRGNFWRVLIVWVPIWFVTTTVTEALSELLEHLGHSQLVHMVAHLVPEALLLPLVALPSVIMTFELVDLERRRAEEPAGLAAEHAEPA
jgi:hypothetical protein